MMLTCRVLKWDGTAPILLALLYEEFHLLTSYLISLSFMPIQHRESHLFCYPFLSVPLLWFIAVFYCSIYLFIPHNNSTSKHLGEVYSYLLCFTMVNFTVVSISSGIGEVPALNFRGRKLPQESKNMEELYFSH